MSLFIMSVALYGSCGVCTVLTGVRGEETALNGQGWPQAEHEG